MVRVMITGFDEVIAWAEGVLENLSEPERKKLSLAIAKDLRKENQRRISGSLNPDGSTYAPRKHQLRNKKGSLRRSMFGKLKTNKYLLIKATSSEALLEFSGAVNKVATTHHYGLRERINKKLNISYQYPSRKLLGLPDQDIDRLSNLLINHLAK